MDKAFYVSPFIAAAGRYAVSVRDEKSRMRITINEQDGAPSSSTGASTSPDASPTEPWLACS